MFVLELYFKKYSMYRVLYSNRFKQFVSVCIIVMKIFCVFVVYFNEIQLRSKMNDNII